MKKDSNFYLLLVIIIVCIAGFCWGLYEKWLVPWQFYVGISLLLVTFISFYKWKEYSRYLLGITLVLASFHAADFTPFQMHFQIGFIIANVIPMGFLLVFMIMNRSRILDLLQGSKPSAEEISDESQSRHNRFKADFQNLPDAEIAKRLELNLTEEARNALLEIVEERRNKGQKL